MWARHGANLGTLLRTCDAVGACLAVPPHRWVNAALAKGNTLRHHTCVHHTGDPLAWLAAQQKAGSRIIAVELADQAVEIPMVGHGGSLNVAVAGSMVLYRLAGLV